MIPIDFSLIDTVNFSGKGGKEKELCSLLTESMGWKRQSNKLFDFVNNESEILLEVKKQKDLQWFDPSKYANITKEEKDIDILFVLIGKNGTIDSLHTMKTEHFVENVWTEQQLKDSFDYITKYPKDQIKSGIKIRTFLDNNYNKTNTLYKRGIMYKAGDILWNPEQQEKIQVMRIHHNVIPTLYTVRNGDEQLYIVSEDDIEEVKQ
jgi:hypothetical protein